MTDRSIQDIKSSSSMKQGNHKKSGQEAAVPLLSYAALLNGKRVETVSPFMISQIDCTTGKKDDVRKNRRFYCKDGTALDADWNGTINIARKSKHPFSFNIPLDGTLRTWKTGCISTTQSYIRPYLVTQGAVQAHRL